MITLTDYLMGRDEVAPLTEELLINAQDTVNRLTDLEMEWGRPLVLTSGYRPDSVNETTPHAVQGDAHSTCRGADLRDTGKELSTWCLINIEILEELGFWMESPSSAHDHVHLQTYPPKSGNRVFIA